jgi:hypothetical protein
MDESLRAVVGMVARAVDNLRIPNIRHIASGSPSTYLTKDRGMVFAREFDLEIYLSLSSQPHEMQEVIEDKLLRIMRARRVPEFSNPASTGTSPLAKTTTLPLVAAFRSIHIVPAGSAVVLKTFVSFYEDDCVSYAGIEARRFQSEPKVVPMESEEDKALDQTKRRQIILTFYNQHIAVVLERLVNCPVLPEFRMLDLGPVIIPNVDRFYRYQTDYSEERDETGSVKFITVTIDYFVP